MTGPTSQREPTPRLIGLTGGIASGKSTVHRMLVELGATVLDADVIYHELIAPVANQPSPLAQAIASTFAEVLQPDGHIDRKRLGALVFSDAEARERLGRITHPAVAAQLARRVHDLGQRGIELVVYDVPLLYERGLESSMEGVIVVWVPHAVQLARLQAREHMSEAEAQARLSSQLPLDEKRRRADWVIDNSGTVEETRQQVQRVWERIA